MVMWSSHSPVLHVCGSGDRKHNRIGLGCLGGFNPSSQKAEAKKWRALTEDLNLVPNMHIEHLKAT